MPLAKSYQTFLVVLVLTIIAALSRFNELGSLGFYGDEETTAFPARSLSQGNGTNMPSGMPYYRALPLTMFNALSARVFGPNEELSYRLPSALFGTLTVPLLFLLTRPLLGTATALVAAVMLSFSEWHIITSREARMYSPFLFAYMFTAFSLWHWATSNKNNYFFLAAVLFLLTVSLHTLGIFAIMFALIPIAFTGWSRVSPWRLTLFAVIAAILAHLYSHYFVAGSSMEWKVSQGVGPVNVTHDNAVTGMNNSFENPDFFSLIQLFGGIVGALLGLWAQRRNQLTDHNVGSALRKTGCYILASFAAALACSGHLHGAVICGLLLFLMTRQGGIAFVKSARTPLVLIASIAGLQVVSTIVEQGPIIGIKSLFIFPFPYMAYLGEMSPGILALFGAMTTLLCFREFRTGEHPLRASIMAVLLPVAAIGVVSKWGGARYLIEVYPFLLIVAAASLVMALTVLGRRTGRWNTKGALVGALFIVLSGALGGHGLPQAWRLKNLKYGDKMDIHAFGFPLYPDHQSAGRYVITHRTQGDIVIAEDALQQRWYIGDVDYWLRDPITHSRFLYRQPDGNLRDIYVDSTILTKEILTALTQHSNKRIWVITSAETHHKQNYYLNTVQRQWLDFLEHNHTPAYIGRDGITKVYCLNCEAD
jgi:4-amino-4-deoxy-L-arabinose transferase-like glycosyltransferase